MLQEGPETSPNKSLRGKTRAKLWVRDLTQGLLLSVFFSYTAFTRKRDRLGTFRTGQTGGRKISTFDTLACYTAAHWILRPRAGGQYTKSRTHISQQGGGYGEMRSLKISCGYGKQGRGATATEVAGRGKDNVNACMCRRGNSGAPRTCREITENLPN